MPSRRVLLALGLLALALRAGVFAHNVRSNPEAFRIDAAERERIEAGLTDPERPFLQAFGFEAANVAWALVCDGRGIASPFGGRTGSTAWVSPALFAAWALAFSIWGCFTTGAVFTVFALAAVASASIVVLGAVAAARLHGSAGAGVAGGLLLLLSPWDLAVFHARSMLDPNLRPLAAMALVTVALALAGRGSESEGRRLGTVALYALTAALATLVSAVLVLPAAVTLALIAWRRPGRVPLAPAFALFFAVHVLVVGPYASHQHRAVGAGTFVKSNLPFEIYLGNLPEVSGVYDPDVFGRHHPCCNVAEHQSYRRLGERAYVRSRFRRFVEAFDLARFTRATARRTGHLLFLHRERPWQGPWSARIHHLLALVPGLVLLGYPVVVRRQRRLRLGDGVIYAFVGAYLVPFVLVGVVERYQLPLFPPLMVLAAGVLPWVARRARTRTRTGGRGDGSKRAPTGSGRFS